MAHGFRDALAIQAMRASFASPPRVALVGPVHPWRGGIAQYTMLLDQALRRCGADVTLVSFSRLYPARLYPGDNPVADGPNPLLSNQPHYWLDGTHPFTWLTAFLRLRRQRPSLLILQWWTPVLAPLLRTLCCLNARGLRASVVIICHNVLPHEPSWFDPRVARCVLQGGHRFLVQSPAQKELLLQVLRHAVPARAIAVQEHPPYVFPHDPRLTRAEARRRLDLPEQGAMLLFCGLVRPYKGLDDLLAALPVIRRARPDAFLAICGEFWMPQTRIRAQIRRLGLEEAVLIRDAYVPDAELALHFQAASLLCAPYRRNTGSGVVAAAYGFPLGIVRTGTAPSDQEREGIFTARPGDRQHLAQQILRALEAPRDWRRSTSSEAAWLQLARTLLA